MEAGLPLAPESCLEDVVQKLRMILNEAREGIMRNNCGADSASSTMVAADASFRLVGIYRQGSQSTPDSIDEVVAPSDLGNENIGINSAVSNESKIKFDERYLARMLQAEAQSTRAPGQQSNSDREEIKLIYLNQAVCDRFDELTKVESAISNDFRKFLAAKHNSLCKTTNGNIKQHRFAGNYAVFLCYLLPLMRVQFSRVDMNMENTKNNLPNPVVLSLQTLTHIHIHQRMIDCEKYLVSSPSDCAGTHRTAFQSGLQSSYFHILRARWGALVREMGVETVNNNLINRLN